MMLAPNSIHCMDWVELLGGLDDASVDALIVDPPYGIGQDEWDRAIDIAAFSREAYRVVKPGGFLAYFGQMPTVLDWMVEFRGSEWRYKDHISWVKRNASNVATPLHRHHESILVYSKGAGVYHQVKGRYEDVKLPGVLLDTCSLEGIDRYIKDLRIKASIGLEARGIHRGNDISNKVYRFMPNDISDRSPEFTNFTNVWSFLPETKQSSNIGFSEHISLKPTNLLVRLCELLTPENGLVVDCFAGSGSTAVACIHSGRRYIIGDLSPEYCEIAKRRCEPEFGKPPKRSKPVLPMEDLPLFAPKVGKS